MRVFRGQLPAHDESIVKLRTVPIIVVVVVVVLFCFLNYIATSHADL